MKHWFFLLIALPLWNCSLFAECIPEIYVANPNAHTVTVLSGADNNIIATIDIVDGVSPVRLTCSPNGKQVYVANSGNDSYSVIDTATKAFSTFGLYPTDHGPIDIEFSPGGTKAYVVNEKSSTVTTVNTANNSLGATIKIGNPGAHISAIAISSDGKFGYVTEETEGQVFVIDLTNFTLFGSPITVGSFPFDIAITPDGTKAYVANIISNSITQINIPSNTTSTINDIMVPFSVAISPDGKTLYAGSENDTFGVYVINTLTSSVTTTIPIDMNFSIYDLALTSDGSKAYVSSPSANSLALIDAVTNTLLLQPINAGISPFGIAITPCNNQSLALNVKASSNKDIWQTDIYNILSWTAPSKFMPTQYQIFSQSALIATVPADTFTFEHHHLKPRKTYTYTVIAENATGEQITIGNASIKTKE